jgi:type III pantothenate kinase
MQNLSIDIGNSYTKIAVFENKNIIHYKRYNEFKQSDLAHILKDFKIKNSVISTVDEDIVELEAYLRLNTNYTRFTTKLSNGVKNNYGSPNTLGLDRWAAVIAAKSLGLSSYCLVIDAGTCITYDILTANSTYFGGSISPGINMRFKAMHEFTGRLPLVSWDVNDIIPEGSNTHNAIRNGVLQGVLNEIEGFIAHYNNEEATLKVILTGGDAEFLFKQLQNSIFAPQIIIEPYLVLKGLNEVIA